MLKSVLSTFLILLTSYAWSQSDTIIVFHPEEMACWSTCDKENTPKTRRQCTENNLFDYIKSHINQAALKGLNNNTEAELIIEANGTVSRVSLARPLSPTADAEIIRVLSSTNAWIPAMDKGKKVRSRLRVPLSFRATDVENITFTSFEELFCKGYIHTTIRYSDYLSLISMAKESKEPIACSAVKSLVNISLSKTSNGHSSSATSPKKGVLGKDLLSLLREVHAGDTLAFKLKMHLSAGIDVMVDHTLDITE